MFDQKNPLVSRKKFQQAQRTRPEAAGDGRDASEGVIFPEESHCGRTG